MSKQPTKPVQNKVKTLLAYSGVMLKNGVHLSNGNIESFIVEAEEFCKTQDKENLSTLKIRNAIVAAKEELRDRKDKAAQDKWIDENFEVDRSKT